MKNKIKDALKTRYTGVADSLLDRIAEKLAKTVTLEDDITAAVDGAFSLILEAYGDTRATESAQTAVRNYERKHNLKDGKQVRSDDGQSADTADKDKAQEQPEWVKALIDSNRQLKARLDRMDGERTVQGRKARLEELIKGLPEQLRTPYRYINLEKMSEDEFEQMVNALPDEVSGASKFATSQQAVFGRPMAAGSTKQADNKPSATDAEVDAVVKGLHIK